LPIGSSVLRKLSPPLRVHYQPIEAKTRQGEPADALLTHLAEGEACLLTPGADLEPFANLVLLFPGIPAEVYGKVRELKGDGSVLLAFTTLPAAARDWIRSLGAADSLERLP
jgi:hypothetical protein